MKSDTELWSSILAIVDDDELDMFESVQKIRELFEGNK